MNLMELDPSYAAFSIHEMLGSLGVGVLYKNESAPQLKPFYLGGEMVQMQTCSVLGLMQ